MYSPLMAASSCSMMDYRMLSASSEPSGIGSVFQVMFPASLLWASCPPVYGRVAIYLKIFSWLICPHFETNTSQPWSIGTCHPLRHFPVLHQPSIFQTMQYSTPRIGDAYETLRGPALNSGYAVVARPGQLIYRKSSMPDDIIGWWENGWM